MRRRPTFSAKIQREVKRAGRRPNSIEPCADLEDPIFRRSITREYREGHQEEADSKTPKGRGEDVDRLEAAIHDPPDYGEDGVDGAEGVESCGRLTDCSFDDGELQRACREDLSLCNGLVIIS